MEDRVTERGRIAEGILSLVLPAERAAAVTGDFVEEFEGRGEFWFWSSVLRLFFSCIYNEWKQAPREFVELGVRGFMVNFATNATCEWGLGLLAYGVFSSAGRATDGSVHETVIAVANCISAWATGLWLGHRAPGREIAACLALGVVPLSILFLVLATIPVWGVEKIHFHATGWNDWLCYAVVICGGLRARRA
jgi:hypothetical protein